MSYDVNSIETLSFRDAVRTRVAMYMGSADNQGVLQCVREIITNSIDEATMGFCNRIVVDLYDGNRITVLDNGRGCPLVCERMVSMHLKQFIPFLIAEESSITKFTKMWEASMVLGQKEQPYRAIAFAQYQ